MRKRVPKARHLDGVLANAVLSTAAVAAAAAADAAKRTKTGPRRSQKAAKKGQEGQEYPQNGTKRSPTWAKMGPREARKEAK